MSESLTSLAVVHGGHGTVDEVAEFLRLTVVVRLVHHQVLHRLVQQL